MATKLTAHGVSTTTTPAQNNSRCFTQATVQDVKNITNTITATQMEHCSHVYVPHSRSANNVVTGGSTKNNNISQVVI